RSSAPEHELLPRLPAGRIRRAPRARGERRARRGDPMTPLVDVAVVTYNHARFIRQALDSVLSQETSFDVRILVGDRCSTARTQAILSEYDRAHPGKVITIFHAKNEGILSPNRIGLKVLAKCTSKYVAMLDGDDYWTDDQKLRLQVDVLEKRPDIAICFHN